MMNRSPSIRIFTTDGREKKLDRREWLRLGGLTSAGCLASFAAGARETTTLPAVSAGFGRARSVILIYASGGQSQLETWDPKPHAPENVRGEFRAIGTSAPGTFIGEHLPRVARLADRFTIVRSLSHDDLDHGSAGYLALTGRPHPQKSSNPPPRPSDEPTYGALLQRVRPRRTFPYEAVHLNAPALVPFEVGPGQDGGYLGRRYEPLVVGDVNATAHPLPDLAPRLDLPLERLAARQNLRQAMEHACREAETSACDGRQAAMNETFQQAFAVLAAPRCRAAFDLAAEPEALRERYGRNRLGQACLLARRLVEAGVPLITVMCNHSNRGQDKEPHNTDAYGWDTHNDIFQALRVHLLPRFDLAFSALLEDLDHRGLLDETLVVCLGEFGRAPRIALEPSFAGRTPGRKHWASVYSAVVAGAGVARGGLFGGSDRFATQPVSDRVGPWDMAATLFWSLGIDPATEYQDLEGRPRVLSSGRPIKELFG